MISTAGSKQPSQYQSSSATTSTGQDHHPQAMATNSNSTVLTTSGIIARMTSSSVEKQRTVSDSESEINYDMFSTSVTSADGAGSSLMNSSQISNTSTDSTHVKSANLTRSQNVGGVSCLKSLSGPKVAGPPLDSIRLLVKMHYAISIFKLKLSCNAGLSATER